MKMKDKVVILTGGNSGVGQCAVRLFTQEGAQIIALDLNTDWLETFAADHPNVTPRQANVADEERVRQIVAETMERYGRIDVLLNIAGIFDGFHTVLDTGDEYFEKIMQVNMYSPLYATRAVLPHMLAADKGSIVTVASIAGTVGFRGGLAYTMSKHAVVGMTKNIGFTYANTNVRINAVCPGGINAPLLLNGHANSAPLGMERYLTGKGIKPRNCEPEEVAEVCLFLASDAASGITGTEMHVSAGASAY